LLYYLLLQTSRWDACHVFLNPMNIGNGKGVPKPKLYIF